jgi:hypothetical protein
MLWFYVTLPDVPLAFSAAHSAAHAERKAISRYCFQPHVSPLATGGAVSNSRLTKNISNKGK